MTRLAFSQAFFGIDPETQRVTPAGDVIHKAYRALREAPGFLAQYWNARLRPSVAGKIVFPYEGESATFFTSASQLVTCQIRDGVRIAQAVHDFASDNGLDDDEFASSHWQTLFRLQYPLESFISPSTRW